MRVKNWFKKIIPAYRVKETIIDDLHTISRMIQDINKKIDDHEQKEEYLFFCLQHLMGETEFETKKRVFLNLPKADGILRDRQLITNYILQRIKKICANNDIQFSLSGGTLLGAVRHHGFIPWDDDIDVGIFRNDYYKFENAINNDDELIMRRYYSYTSQGIPGYVSKVKLRTSEFFFVDVFSRCLFTSEENSVLDNWMTICELEKKFKNELGEILNTEGFFYNSENTYQSKWSPNIDSKVILIEKKYDKLFEEVSDKDIDNSFCCLGINEISTFFYHEGYDRSTTYLPLKKDCLEFEGDKYSGYCNYDLWLQNEFGDYWTFPKRILQTHKQELKPVQMEDIQTVKDSLFFD